MGAAEVAVGRFCALLAFLALFLTAFAFAFTAVAVFSPSWLAHSGPVVGDLTLGLFYACSGDTCSSKSDTEPMDWQKAFIALEIVGILCSVPCLVLAILYVFVPATSGKTPVKISALSLSFGAGLFVTLGAVVCAAKKDDMPEVYPGFHLTFDLSWSFAMAIIGGLLHLASGVFFVLDMML